MNERRAEAVLLTGVYGSGKSTLAVEMAYLLEQRGDRYALLDLDYLSWAATSSGERSGEFGLMLTNLEAVAANYRRAGIVRFVLAYFVRTAAEAQAIQQALGLPLRVVRLVVDLPEIRRRLAGDLTSGRRDDLLAAEAALEAAEGAGLEDVAIANYRPVDATAREVLAYLDWI